MSFFGRHVHGSGTAGGRTRAPDSWGTHSVPAAKSWQQAEVSPDLEALDPGFDEELLSKLQAQLDYAATH